MLSRPRISLDTRLEDMMALQGGGHGGPIGRWGSARRAWCLMERSVRGSFKLGRDALTLKHRIECAWTT